MDISKDKPLVIVDEAVLKAGKENNENNSRKETGNQEDS